MIAAFVPPTMLLGGFLGLQTISLLGMYLLGVVVALPISWLARRTILRGESQPFLMELPTYKWPSLRTVFYRVYEQARAFCVSAGTLIVAVTILLWALGYYPRPAAIAALHETKRGEVRARYDRRLPIIVSSEPPRLRGEGPRGMNAAALGESTIDDLSGTRSVQDRQSTILEELDAVDREEAGAYFRQSFLGRLGGWIEPVVKPLGWDGRIGTAVLASFPAREVVIATMGTIYNLGDETDETSQSLRETLKSATWPDGRRVFNVAVAFSIMVFFSLCCQCGATLAVIKRETQSWRWPIFTFAYMTILAYAAAFLTYQAMSRWLPAT